MRFFFLFLFWRKARGEGGAMTMLQSEEEMEVPVQMKLYDSTTFEGYYSPCHVHKLVKWELLGYALFDFFFSLKEKLRVI